MGPNSKSLLRAITCNSNHPRIHVASFVRGATDGPSPDDIAIVGMSVNYPSGKGPEQLWETLEKGLNVVREIPSSRFQISDYYDSNADSSNKNPRKMNAKYGNFLDDPFAFDNTFFQISPREAKSMDPQQRLLLHAALEAMEDAGYAPDSTPSFQRESTGVYVGAATLDYVDNTRNDIDVYYSPGTLRAFLSGRISQTGQCKPWDASADGYCRAEGCGLFVLKKLSDAVAEGDRIYGVIRGAEVNQCGTAKSITHPDSDTQARLFKSLLTKTKIDPNSIGVVEAHGTGTQAGDYAEEYDAFRLSVTGHSTTDILRKLRQAKVPPRAPPSKRTFTAFVFSGQGGVYPGMGAELLSTAPVFRENVRLCNATLADLGFPAVDALIGEDLDVFQSLTPRDQVIVSQCACFVLEYCLAQLWMAWGIAPDVVTGHSVGEYAALVTAGVLSLRDGLLLVARRAELMADLCEEASTGMAACNMPPRKAASFISAPTSGFDGLTVACKNSTDDCVVGGPVAPLRRFVDFCKASGIKAKVLEVPFAFHSAAMDPILEPFAQVVSTVTINKPNIPVASSYLGKLLDNGDVNAEYFVGHTRQPVEFVCAAEVIQRLADQREMHVIEVGPAPISVVFKSKISALSEFIKAHNVGGAPLCPASVYIELAFEALDLTKREGSAQDKFRTLTDLTFDKPLVYSDAHDIDIHTHLSPDGSSFRVQSEGNTLHSAGTVATTTDDHVLQNFARLASYIKRQTESVTFVDTFSTRILYDVIFPRVVAYSGPYVTINQLSIAASGLEATGTFQLPASGGAGFACPPALTDTLLHAAGFVANSKVSADEACICVKVERVTVPCGDDAAAWCGRQMRVYCGLVECFGDTFVGDAYALDGAGAVLAAVEGMHFKRLRLRAFQAHLARALKPVAKPPAAAAAARKDSAVELGRVVQGGRVEAARSTAGREGLGGEAVRSGIRPVLHGCLSELCGVAEAGIDENARLSEMGVDSLLFIELTSTLQQRFQHLNLTGSDFGSCETVLDVEQVLKKMTAGSSTPQFEVAPEVPVMPAAPECIAPSHGISDVDGFFQEVCGFSLRDVDADSTMDSLGVDSLLSIELATGLRETFGIEIDQSRISDMSIRELEKAICTVPSAQQPEPEQEPVDIPHAVPELKGGHTAMILGMDTFPMHLQRSPNTGKKGAPLYMFHDGSGLCNVYSRLGELGRDIYGIFSLDFSHIDRSITTLEDLASHYIDRAHLAEQESIMLGGWSFGGVLAFEVSRQLRRRGSKTAVLGVVLVDSPHPVAHEPLPEAVVSHVCGQLPARTPAMRGVRAAIEAQFHRNARLLGRYGPRPAGDGGAGPDARCVMVKCSGTFDAEALCGVAYPWLSDDECRAQSVKVWESLVGRSVPTLDCLEV
ncbi:putative polyketide synthase protein [Neofusicoccum parvum UCRNP2]|uniref:Putative polyketide synthase protein n=1 Tax=Botryosphaeria parva (strain UCR-NP2) TaxID=1287680 RepID=R1GES8_BOTPV|nr:putative polyketide synthase protein [Neofusicoccum parvum UCRNP2]